MREKNGWIVVISVLLVLIIDQWLKIYIKLNFFYNQEVAVFGNWFKLLFVENEGMAFGQTIPFLSPLVAKITLSVFRILAVSAIAYYLVSLLKKGVATGLVWSIAMVFAGALGNIIDSAFYGLIFTESTHFDFAPARLVPIGEGYADFLTGNVVDMLKFDLFTVDLPFYGRFNFFAPIFNIADVAISIGVFYILLFQRKNFQKEFFNDKKKEINNS